MFVPKPATYITFDTVQSITFSRIGGAVSALSTFDITVVLKSGGGSNQFSNINREDLKALETFFKHKGLRVKNEIDEDANLLAAALREQAMDESDDEPGAAGAGADRGSADEDEESVDEDFRADSESDVAEEYDSAHESSGSGSGESDVDDDDDEEMDDDEGEEDARPKKKSKTG